MEHRDAQPAGDCALRRDARRNRAAIIDAARTVFAEQGLDAPLEEIARRAGVGIGTLYRRFPRREHLLDAIFLEAFEADERAVRSALEQPDAWSGLAHAMTQVCQRRATDRGLGDITLARLSATCAVDGIRRRILGLLDQLVHRAQDAGQLRRDATVADIMCAIWGTIRIIELTVPAVPDVWERHLALQLDGLRTGAAHPLPAAALTLDELAAVRRPDRLRGCGDPARRPC